jgi:hypothetical protein
MCEKKPGDDDCGLKFFTMLPIRQVWRISGFFAVTVGSGVGPRPAILTANALAATADGRGYEH